MIYHKWIHFDYIRNSSEWRPLIFVYKCTLCGIMIKDTDFKHPFKNPFEAEPSTCVGSLVKRVIEE